MADKRRAAIIGIDTYNPESGLRNLQGARNDAQNIKDRLKEWGGFDVEENSLTDGQATCENIRRTIDNLFFKPSDDELALFYFSGHGVMDGYGNRYLAPYDMNTKEPFVRGISLEELTKAAKKSKIRQSIMILDSCYSGEATKSDEDRDVQKDLEVIIEPISKEKSTGQCKAILASTPGNMLSREKLDCRHALGNMPPHPHGVYTFVLIEGLDGGARDAEGRITLDKLIDYIDREFAVGQFSALRQKPIRSISEGFNLADIFIAKDPIEFDTLIRKHIDDALEYDLNDPTCLSSAVNTVCRILLKAPENPQAKKIKTDIDRHITEFFHDKVDKVLGHEQKIKDIATKTYKKEFGEIFNRMWIVLETDCYNLSVDKIYQIEEPRKETLINLLKLSLQEPKEENFGLFVYKFRKAHLLRSKSTKYSKHVEPRKPRKRAK